MPSLLELVQQRTHSGVPVGSVAILRDGELRTASWGCEPHTLFQAASISKPMAAVAALALVARGELDLDADVNDRLTSWRLPAAEGWAARVSVRQLLCHGAALSTSGFPGYRIGVELPGLVDILDGRWPANTAAVRLRGVPGLAHCYSGGGYTVLQQLLEDVTGRPLPELVAEYVFRPAGMTTARYTQPRPGQAATAECNGRPVSGGWRVYPEQAAAGVWCTPTDLVRFAASVQAGTLLPGDLAAEFLTEQLPGWGLGVTLAGSGAGRFFGHTGGNEGYRCELTATTQDAGPAIAVMTSSDTGAQLIEDLLPALRDLVSWPDPPRRADPRPDALDMVARYAGDYVSATGVVLTVAGAGWNWTLTTPGQPPLAIVPHTMTLARAQGLGLKVEFTLDGAGRATGLTVRQQDNELTAGRRDRP